MWTVDPSDNFNSRYLDPENMAAWTNKPVAMPQSLSRVSASSEQQLAVVADSVEWPVLISTRMRTPHSCDDAVLVGYRSATQAGQTSGIQNVKVVDKKRLGKRNRTIYRQRNGRDGRKRLLLSHHELTSLCWCLVQ